MDEVYKKNPDFVYRRIAGETILVPIRKAIKELQSIYSFNDTACAIWDKIDGRRSMEEIILAMQEEFEVSSETLKADTQELVERLKTVGALECVR